MNVDDLARNRIDQALLTRALSWTLAAHRDQARKAESGQSARIPYASHLLQVCGLVMEHGGSIDQAVAALLHDAIEDQDHVDEALVRRDFGDAIAQMVVDCSDAHSTPKPPWRERKEKYLARLDEHARDGAPSTLISACDKLHNLTTLVADVDTHGLGYLDRFNAGPTEQLWYFGAVLDAYSQAPESCVPVRLRRAFALRLRDFTAQLASGGLDVEEPASVAAALDRQG